jgi:imidazoleglycerol-phosphate dehydratase
MRQANVTRQTSETKISMNLNIDGSGQAEINTGIGFFDHMLTMIAKHGRLDLTVKAEGDLFVDDHHTVEDVGIVLGQALGQALADKRGINRYGQASIPMDEALGTAVLDISGRPFLVFQADFKADRIGGFSTQMAVEFFRALAFAAEMTLHLACPYGDNDHHKLEALCKAFAHSLKKAAAVDPAAAGDILSTKGVL